jgi:hypothetical protein
MARGYGKKLLRVAPVILDPSVMVIPTKLNNLKVESKKTIAPPSTLYLPSGYEPTDQDILCGRSRESFHHVGNRYLRTLVAIHLKRYIVGNRTDKTQLAKEVVNTVRESGGKFIKFDDEFNLWFEIEDKGARSKVAHAFRDSLAHVRESIPQNNNSNNTSPKASAATAKREREWSTAKLSPKESHESKLKQSNLKPPPPGKSENTSETAPASLKKETDDSSSGEPAPSKEATTMTAAIENPLDVLVRAMDVHRERSSSENSGNSSY